MWVNVFYYAAEGPSLWYSDYYQCWCSSLNPFYMILWPKWEYDVKYNSQGLVESMTYLDYGSINNYRSIQYQYNANGYLLSSDTYLRPVGSAESEWKLTFKDIYFYDAYENWVGTRSTYYLGGAASEVDDIYSARVDSKGRIVYSENVGDFENISGKHFLDYFIWYYSDGRTPNVEVDNNTTINSDNQGGFDVNVNIPTDSINNGSITVTFPEGFMFDEKNTGLRIGSFVRSYQAEEDFELIITEQENNSWLFEIKPKNLKSASLRADEEKIILHIAYTTDESVETGTYNISVNNILFETNGGDYIPEPAITVPVVLESGNTGIQSIHSLTPAVYAHNQTLYIQGENAEQIAIYSIAGNKLYEATIQKGLNTININPFRQEVLIVKGSSGWVKKVF